MKVFGIIASSQNPVFLVEFGSEKVLNICCTKTISNKISTEIVFFVLSLYYFAVDTQGKYL